mmetsp:Transcript_119970/g.334682  ORF Transcript_119970/g.334682 Transcript_119970/m.334682 type:complete len:314 (-) Transcript_119970:102-1043(-)|eukprot:CAMPEP_0179119138 /NCGR_PEP_ID=MMETSP0796-20121207/56071_1 /TAXON_ID=73915 /ORGANISM="Pyrodinium bahamense, Strain pbaha01" /LENGTH=313 /DNA_ID=CAMNT_0020817631 /DNA_START=135 /DNA_END=1076 /DNA_ORIENTATION=-
MKEICSVLCVQAFLLLLGTGESLEGASSSNSLSSHGTRVGQKGSARSTEHFLWHPMLMKLRPAVETWALRICNAYAFKSGLDVFHVRPAEGGRTAPKPEQLTHASGPLAYQRCADLVGVHGLEPGSELDFRLSDGPQVGCFHVTQLPTEGSLLQIVVHRHDTSTTAAAFSSHVFDSSSDTEIAVVDAYRGAAVSRVAVRSTAGAPWQDLRFDTAVSLMPGWYEWLLTGDHEKTYHGGEVLGFRLSSGEKVTAIRTGVQALHGPSYDEELVLFPTGWLTVRSLAFRRHSPCLWVVLFSAGFLSVCLEELRAGLA